MMIRMIHAMMTTTPRMTIHSTRMTPATMPIPQTIPLMTIRRMRILLTMVNRWTVIQMLWTTSRMMSPPTMSHRMTKMDIPSSLVRREWSRLTADHS